MVDRSGKVHRPFSRDSGLARLNSDAEVKASRSSIRQLATQSHFLPEPILLARWSAITEPPSADDQIIASTERAIRVRTLHENVHRRKPQPILTLCASQIATAHDRRRTTATDATTTDEETARPIAVHRATVPPKATAKTMTVTCTPAAGEARTPLHPIATADNQTLHEAPDVRLPQGHAATINNMASHPRQQRRKSTWTP